MSTEKGKYENAIELFHFLMECQPTYRMADYIQLPLHFARELNQKIIQLKFMYDANTDRLKEAQNEIKE